MAWQLYVDDNESKLVPTAGPTNGNWCAGWCTLPPGTDNTNLTLLRNSLLGSYTVNTAIYKCPGDKSVNVRSYSVNNHMNGISFDGDGGGVVFRKSGAITRPTDYFVFIDEDISTINDSMFRVDITRAIQDEPAAYHNQRGNLSFADGHTESRSWPRDLDWLWQHATELQTL